MKLLIQIIKKSETYIKFMLLFLLKMMFLMWVFTENELYNSVTNPVSPSALIGTLLAIDLVFFAVVWVTIPIGEMVNILIDKLLVRLGFKQAA